MSDDFDDLVLMLVEEKCEVGGRCVFGVWSRNYWSRSRGASGWNSVILYLVSLRWRSILPR